MDTAHVGTSQAVKHDTGKLRYSLIPALFSRLFAQIWTIGDQKYGANNWRTGLEWSRCVDAMERHLNEWKTGASVDPEDGGHRLAKVAWYCAALIEYEKTHPEMNDIPEKATVVEVVSD